MTRFSGFVRVTVASVASAALLASIGCQSGPAPGDIRLYDGVDRYGRQISTVSNDAQDWFDQGLQFEYGFNHQEAIRSYKEAARLDPDSPMPWWGMAHARGMNINDQFMTDERYQLATHDVQEAIKRIDHASPSEVDLINALSKRYSWPAPAEQRTLDQAYADAMQLVWQKYPTDPDIGSLYAESLMNLQPWDYWTVDGLPKGRIGEIVAVLESVIAIDPDHPAANHLYIHAVEASQTPERAEAAADRLLTRIPGAGHLVHMPSHIYVRIGRYQDAADSNVAAVAADRAYMASEPGATVYWIYYAHNLHFLAYASMMEGRYEDALRAARELESDIPEDVLRQFAGLIEGIMPTTFHVMVRFGRWEDILNEPPRADYRLMSNAVRHYARGIAYAALGQTFEAQQEVSAFEAAVAEVPDEWYVFNNQAHTILPVARAMLDGEIAFREGRHDEAFARLRQGIAAEDQLIYDEPPAWMLPVRQSLGALLMSAGRYTEAEAVYREDLRRNPKNGWSLLGLQNALIAQGHLTLAAELDEDLDAAFRRADVQPTSSCYCEP